MRSEEEKGDDVPKTAHDCNCRSQTYFDEVKMWAVRAHRTASISN
jgi:hypothetical protein